MAKVPLNNISGGYASVDAINVNNDIIEQAFDNTISRDGSLPNHMEADFDMNSNDILNAGVIYAEAVVTPGGSIGGGGVGAQPLDSNLTALSGLTGAADLLAYFTGDGTMATTVLTAFARSILSGANAAAVRATIGAAADASTQTIWIPAGAMTSRSTNGAASASVETTSNKIVYKTLNFDPTVNEYAQFQVRMPKGYNGSTVTAYFSWSSATLTGNAVWGIQAVTLRDGDLLDTAFGTAQLVTDSVIAATKLQVSAVTSAVTSAGTHAVGNLITFQVYRDAVNASDTLAEDARLHGVTLIYNTTTLNDA